jgi:hypothetical protein
MAVDDHLPVAVPDRRHQLGVDLEHQLVGDLVLEQATAAAIAVALLTTRVNRIIRLRQRWPHRHRRPTRALS